MFEAKQQSIYANATKNKLSGIRSILKFHEIKALLAACKTLILLDFHRSFNDTRTIVENRRLLSAVFFMPGFFNNIMYFAPAKSPELFKLWTFIFPHLNGNAFLRIYWIAKYSSTEG